MAKRTEMQSTICERTDESESEDDEIQTEKPTRQQIRTETTNPTTTYTSTEQSEKPAVRREKDKEIRQSSTVTV